MDMVTNFIPRLDLKLHPQAHLNVSFFTLCKYRLGKISTCISLIISMTSTIMSISYSSVCIIL